MWGHDLMSLMLHVVLFLMLALLFYILTCILSFLDRCQTRNSVMAAHIAHIWPVSGFMGHVAAMPSFSFEPWHVVVGASLNCYSKTVGLIAVMLI
jgi:hypothetical protein